MPETYGLPDPEPTPIEQFERAVYGALGGNSIPRTVALYALTALLVISPLAALAVVPLVLLLATDTRLS